MNRGSHGRVPLSWTVYRGQPADRLERHRVTRRDGVDTKWLYLFGPSTVAEQVQMCAGGGCVETEMPPQHRAEFSHRLEFPGGLPDSIRSMAELLEEVLSLKTRLHVDMALALDWYKIPEDGVDPNNWKNTVAGELLYRSKYYESRPHKEQLVSHLLDVIDRHLLLAAAPTVVTVPGHAGNGRSFGERLACHLAGQTSKRVVNTQSSGPHGQSKSGSVHEYGDFTIGEQLQGDVLIIDDVYRSGMSMSVAAHAARQAGADRVFGLVAARTLRN